METKLPYTYLVGWTKYNKWYYGVRYSKYSNPKELWKTYFTSSKHVKRFRMKYGDPDIIQIRKIFNDKYKAIKWEQKVLSRLNVEKKLHFLNAKNSTTSFVITNPTSSSFKPGNKPWNKGLNIKELYGEEWVKRFSREKSEEEKLKLSKSQKNRFANTELRDQYRERTKEQYSNTEFKEYHKSKCIPHAGTIWINNGEKNKRVTEIIYLSDFPTWCRGRLILSENKFYNHNNRKRDPISGRFLKKGD